VELSNLQQVYSKLGDDLSREICIYLIMTSISEREEYGIQSLPEQMRL